MMHVVRFFTAMFDVSLERPNPVQPVAGESLLLWLRERAPSDVEMAFPVPGDAGWHSSVNWRERSYIIGATAVDEVNGEWEWVLQSQGERSDSDSLSGQVRVSGGDECVEYIQRLMESKPSFEELTVDIVP
jgi:hypothetical protein